MSFSSLSDQFGVASMVVRAVGDTAQADRLMAQSDHLFARSPVYWSRDIAPTRGLDSWDF